MRTTPTLSRSNAVPLSLVAAIALAIACAVDKPASPDRLNTTQSVAEQVIPAVTPARSSSRGQRPGVSVDTAYTTYLKFQLDKAATLRQPPPPLDLKGSGTGNVFAQFVVDTTGRVDTQTFKPIQSSSAAFAAAVKAALSTARFDPAVVQGKKVRQLIEMGFATANLRDLREKKP